jgi:hypothetical protein
MHQLRRPRLVWRLRVPIAWAASVVLAVGLGYYLGGTGYTPRQPEARVARITDSLATVSGSVREEPAAPPAVAKDSRPRAANQLATRRDEVVDRAAAEAAPESDAPPELRPVTPMPVPRAAVAAARPSAGLTSERGRLVAPEWPVIRPGPARDLLGADPVGIPGLTVRSIRRSPAGDVVLVEQALDSATVIQVFQERVEGARSLPNRDSSAKPQSAAPPLAARQRYAGTERLARFIGGLRVEIAGPLSADSLSRLLEQLKPIP